MPEQKKNFMKLVKENLIPIILTVVISGAIGFFSTTANLARENEKRILALEVTEQEKANRLVEELQTIAIDLGNMDSTTREHERAITRLETLIEVMRGD